MGMVFRRKYRDKAGQVRQCQRWTIRYNRSGKQFEEPAHTTKKTAAERLLKIREGDIGRGEAVSPAMYRVTASDALEEVLADYRANGRRALDDQEGRVRLHLKPFFDGIAVSDLGLDRISQYRGQRTAEGAAVATINRELALLKRGCRLLYRARRVLTVPYIAIVREHNTRKGFFEADDLRSVLDHMPADFRPLVWFAYITGWRWISEVLPMTWGQVDFAAEEVRLEVDTTKNGEGRTFPFTAKLREVLQAQKVSHDELKREGRICPYVFQRQGRPISQGTFWKAWKRARKDAGLPGRNMHDFRRTAVRALTRAGVPQSVAMQMTGHKTDSVFRRYDIVSSADLRDAARKLDARAG